MIDHFTHLFRFQTIVEEGSLRKATERLNVTQPALTRSIALLEAHFGRALLVRHARGVRPTEFGQRVLGSTRRLTRQWNLEQQDLVESGRGSSGVLRLRAGPLWRTVLLPKVLIQLQREFPKVLIELGKSAPSQTISDLTEGRTDIIFGGVNIADVSDQRLRYQELTLVHDRIVAREGHPIFEGVKTGQQIDPGRVLDFPWIIYSADPAYETKTIHGAIERLGTAPHIAIRSDSLLATHALLQEGDYLCILPEAAVAGVSGPRILPVPVGMGQHVIHSGVLYREEIADWPPLQRLIDLSMKQSREIGI